MRSEFWPYASCQASEQGERNLRTQSDSDLAKAIGAQPRLIARYKGTEQGERCEALLVLWKEEQARRANA